MSRRLIIILSSIAVIISVIAVLGIRYLPLLSEQPVAMSSVNTSIVDRGIVTNRIEGEGVVEPQSEVLILSPT